MSITGWVEPAVNSAGFEAVRADAFAPLLGETVRLIVHADAMVADISWRDPNVFYELGVRHASRPFGTVLISAAEQRVLFDLVQLGVTFYYSAALSETAPALSDRLGPSAHGLLSTAPCTRSSRVSPSVSR